MESDILISKKFRWCTIRMAIGITVILLFLLAGTSGASPPPAILEIEGMEQSAGIGSSCWKVENETYSLCIDMIGVITPEEPLLTRSPFTAILRLPLQEPHEELEFSTFRVTDDDELKEASNGVRAWNFKGNALNRYKRPFEREPEFNLSLPSGLYVLNVFAKWEGKGDVSYGFLVQVNDPAAVVIAQPANGQCIEPGQPLIPVTSALENIFVDNSHHHLGNDVKEDLTPKEPEAVVYEKTILLDSGFDTPELNLMAKSVSPYEINATEYMDRVYINNVEVALLNCYFKPTPASLFSMDTGLEGDLNKGIISGDLKSVFIINGFPLSDDAFIISWGKENIWTISDPSNSQKLIISKEGGKLNVYPPAYSPDSSEPAVIKISFDQSLLIIGNNTIKITSGSNKDGSNHDDFWFSQLTLKGVRKTGWILSGKVMVGDESIFPARVYVYRHGTNELLSSFETSLPNGSYSLKLPDGEYDVKAEAWIEFSNLKYDTKTIVINNSNVNLDFKASKFFSNIFPIVLAFFIIPFVFPSIMIGFIAAISVYVCTKKRKIAVFGFVLGTLGTCIINLIVILAIMSGTGLEQLSGELFQSSLLGIPININSSLLLSAVITFILVIVPMILLNRRKIS